MEYQIYEVTEGVTSSMIPADTGRVLDILSTLEVSYRGPYTGIYLDQGQQLYEVFFVGEPQGLYDILGSITIAPNGYLYMDGSRYKVLDQEHYRPLLDICAHSLPLE